MNIQHDSTNKFTKGCFRGLLTTLALFASTFLASGQLVWGPAGGPAGPGQDGPGVWDLTTPSWNAFSETQVPWVNGNVAYIGSGGAAGTITVNAPITVGDIYFRAVGSGSYDLAAGAANDPLTFPGFAQVQVAPATSASISCPIIGNFEATGQGMLTINVTSNAANTGNIQIDSGTIVVNGGTSGNYGAGKVTLYQSGILMVSDNLGGAGHQSVSNAFIAGGTLASAPTGGSVGGVYGYTMFFAPGGSNAFGLLQIDGDNDLLYTDLRFNLDLNTTSATTGTPGANSMNDYVNFTGNLIGAPSTMAFNLNFVGPQPADGTVLTYTVLNYNGPFPPNQIPTVNVIGGATVTSAVLDTNANPHTITVTFGPGGGGGTAASSFTGIVNNGDGSITLNYNVTGGFTYDVQYATSLTSPSWTIIPAGNITPAVSGPVSFTDVNAAANAAATGQIYYRIVSP